MSDIKTIAVVQHTSSEYLGLIEDHLEGRRIRFRYFRPLTSGGRLPQDRELGAGLVLLGGGSWGATAGPWRLPTLDAEIALAREALSAEIPVIGIGLGATILALAAGGEAHAAPLRFDVTTAERTADDALAGFLPPRYPLVRYLRDVALPPAAARVLARDAANQPALFQFGGRAFGFTGHPGVKSAMVEDLVMEFPESPAALQEGLTALRAQRTTLEDALVPIMTGLVSCTGLMD